MKRFMEKYWTGIVISIIVLVLVGWFIFRRQKTKTEFIKTKQKISIFAEQYNAVADWQKIFDEDGIKIGKGHRPVYTTDVENALIRNDGRPALIVGYVFDVSKTGDSHYLGIKALADPNLHFLLECQLEHIKLVLSQSTDDGEFFVVVAIVNFVSRPPFEVDTVTEEDDEGEYSYVIVEPGDQYILKGTCLDIMYVGDYE